MDRHPIIQALRQEIASCEGDSDAEKMMNKLKSIRAEERERCAQIANDWFTIAPRYRTKERLLADIRGQQVEE